MQADYNLEDLFRLVQQDDNAAFDTLYQRTWERLFTLANARLRDIDLAQQVVQDVYVDLWRKRHVRSIVSVEKYLYQAVKYKVIDQFRKRSLKFEVIDDFIDQIVDFELADHNMIQKEYDQLIKKYAEMLPKKRREIFILCYFEGKTNHEISQILNVSTKTVQNQVLNAKIALRQFLQRIIYILFFFLFY